MLPCRWHGDDRAHGVLDEFVLGAAEHDLAEGATSGHADDDQRCVLGVSDPHQFGGDTSDGHMGPELDVALTQQCGPVPLEVPFVPGTDGVGVDLCRGELELGDG